MSDLKPIEVDVEEVRSRLTEMAGKMEGAREQIEAELETVTSSQEVESEIDQFLAANLDIQDDCDALGSAVEAAHQCLVDTVATGVTTMREQFDGTATTAMEVVASEADDFSEKDQTVVDYLQALDEELRNAFTETSSESEAFATRITESGELVTSTATDASEFVNGLAELITGELNASLSNQMDTQRSFVESDSTDRLNSLLEQLSETVVTGFEQFDERASQAADRLMDGAKNSVQNATDHLTDSVEAQFAQSAEEFANDVVKAAMTEAITAGAVMVAGATLTTTLAPAVPALAGAKIATDAIKTAKELLGG